ncbi:MAG: UPF0164 family protein [Spirochaetaceae bacterium]
MRRAAVLLLMSAVALLPLHSQSAETLVWWSSLFDTFEVKNTGLTTFPTLNIPMGGEYEGMGTAYSAVARDSSYFEANPAASSTLTYTELALFHTNLIADANMEGAVYTIRDEDFGLGVGGKFLHVPFTEYDAYGEQEKSIRFTETIVGANASYNFLSGFYFYGIALGTTLKVAYRNNPIRPDQNQAGFMADIGALTRFNALKPYASRDRNASVGVTVKNLGPPVEGEPLPSAAHLGLSYSPLRPLVLSSELIFPFIVGTDDPAEPIGLANGASVTVTDFFSAHTGLLIRGGNPRITLGGIVDVQDITLSINYTLDMTTQIGSFDRFSLQAKFNFGDRGRAEQAKRVEELYLESLVAYAAGDLERTIELTREAVEIDPDFEPAEETLETALRSKALQEEMEQIQLGTQELGPEVDTPEEPEEPREGGE